MMLIMAPKDTTHVVAVQTFCRRIGLFSVSGRRKYTVFKHLIHLLCAYALVAGIGASAGQVFRGTYFLLFVSPNFAVVAIDSLEVTRDFGKSNTIGERFEVCKITILDDHSIFITEGVSGSVRGFSAETIAAEAFPKKATLIMLPQKWAATMIEKLQVLTPKIEQG